MVFLFVLFCPTLFASFWPGHGGSGKSSGMAAMPESRVVVSLSGPEGARIISMEEYLYGALPLVIPADYEPECLKAQAILLRTGILKRYREQTARGAEVLKEDASSCLSGPERKELWGPDYYENSEKIRQAVDDTRGIYISYEGLPVEACYFRVSAGHTRDGSEALGGAFPYLQSVPCSEDYLAEDYLTHFSIKKKEVERITGGTISELKYDSAGYCTSVLLAVQEKSSTQEEGSIKEEGSTQKEGGIKEEGSIKADGSIQEENGVQTLKELSGEAFRELFHFPSASFTIEEEGSRLLFTVKGTGHGVGFCQYAANRMAMEGCDYHTIISYFYQNTALDKYE